VTRRWAKESLCFACLELGKLMSDCVSPSASHPRHNRQQIPSKDDRPAIWIRALSSLPRNDGQAGRACTGAKLSPKADGPPKKKRRMTLEVDTRRVLSEKCGVAIAPLAGLGPLKRRWLHRPITTTLSQVGCGRRWTRQESQARETAEGWCGVIHEADAAMCFRGRYGRPRCYVCQCGEDLVEARIARLELSISSSGWPFCHFAYF
jgi:hypothetical protein